METHSPLHVPGRETAAVVCPVGVRVTAALQRDSITPSMAWFRNKITGPVTLEVKRSTSDSGYSAVKVQFGSLSSKDEMAHLLAMLHQVADQVKA